jgi:putative phage-type endonuclease
MRIILHEQRSEGWFAARRGVPTASSFNRLITSAGKRSASADGYIDELIAEKITGESKFFPTTAAMQHGIDTEPKARAYYEFMHEVDVLEIGLCLHDTIDAGASPDGLIGNDGLIEIKCPQAHTMVKYWRDNAKNSRIPIEYLPQVQGQLWITERDWCDVLCYHESIKPMLIRVFRDEDFIASLAEIVADAVDTINFNAEKLRGK